MWDTEVVLARFIEACDVERRMVVKGGPGTGNAWPSYCYEDADMAGWDDQARADHLEQWQGRKVTKSPELGRWEECFYQWTPLIPLDRRALVWRFAACAANGWSFSAWCQKKGINRSTAVLRVDRVIAQLAGRFSKEGRRLHEPDPRWTSKIEVAGVQEDNKIRNLSDARRHAPYRSEALVDTLGTPEAMAAFVAHLEDSNGRRRKARLRREARRAEAEA